MASGAAAGIAAGGLGLWVIRVWALDPVLATVLTRDGAGGQATAHVLLASTPTLYLDPVCQGPRINHIGNKHQG